ncbi:hypothetical protein BCR34DRAFT_127070 [Clohesyomyces aquaticus]|uniref:Uncharacterized protein n=1 Tax=Clohesyomyces aquaticus TaxID=1231657 RepID=A0A1Y1YN10_9PLEO|nr:hypothetical protein BCR34DRAFT_127070 [Clohesyomyces aquaticus]
MQNTSSALADLSLSDKGNVSTTFANASDDDDCSDSSSAGSAYEGNSAVLDTVTRQQFEEGRTRRFGTTNPEVMDIVFWRAMVEARTDPWGFRQKFPKTSSPGERRGEREDEGISEVNRSADERNSEDEGNGDEQDGKHDGEEQGNGDGDQSSTTATAATEQHQPTESADQAPHKEIFPGYGPPIWCNPGRLGQPRITLLDGTKVEIAGEHEDFYDPDFLVYNDVIVYHPDKTFTIYGYPEEDFPPTDFHTATYHPGSSSIYIIGNMSAPSGTVETPVYWLRTTDWKIFPLAPTGKSPGCIAQHRAELQGDEIRVWGGRRYGGGNGEEGSEVENGKAWVLRLKDLVWREG